MNGFLGAVLVLATTLPVMRSCGEETLQGRGVGVAPTSTGGQPHVQEFTLNVSWMALGDGIAAKATGSHNYYEVGIRCRYELDLVQSGTLRICEGLGAGCDNVLFKIVGEGRGSAEECADGPPTRFDPAPYLWCRPNVRFAQFPLDNPSYTEPERQMVRRVFSDANLFGDGTATYCVFITPQDSRDPVRQFPTGFPHEERTREDVHPVWDRVDNYGNSWFLLREM